MTAAVTTHDASKTADQLAAELDELANALEEEANDRLSLAMAARLSAQQLRAGAGGSRALEIAKNLISVLLKGKRGM